MTLVLSNFFTEILFGALGRIKKVKIYTTALGKQKGDALVTFVLAETAITACFKVRIYSCFLSMGVCLTVCLCFAVQQLGHR